MATKKTKKTEPAQAEAEAEAPVVEETPAEETPKEEALEADPPFDPAPFLADDEEEDESFEATEPEAKAPAEEPKEEPKVEEPAPAEEPAPEPEAKPAEPAPEPAPAAEEQPAVEEPPAAPVVETKTPEQLQQEHTKWREESEAKLTEFYAIDKEDAELLLTEPEKVIPKLAARLHLEVSTAVAEAVKSLLPSAIQQMSAQQSVAEKQEGEFFKAWPKLNDTKHHNTLQRLGVTYRNSHPQATPDDFIRDVGAMAMVALRIPFDEPAAPEPEPKVPPHVPAAAAGGSAPARPTSTNPFAQFVDELAAEEEVE
jgi:hypothetical protein